MTRAAAARLGSPHAPPPPYEVLIRRPSQSLVIHWRVGSSSTDHRLMIRFRAGYLKRSSQTKDTLARSNRQRQCRKRINGPLDAC